MPGRLTQVLAARGAGPSQVEIHATCLGLDHRYVAQLLDGLLDIGAVQRSYEVTQTRVLAAPIAYRADAETAARHGQLRETDAVVQFEQGRLHIAELPLTPFDVCGAQGDIRYRTRIRTAAWAAGCGGPWRRFGGRHIKMQPVELQIPRLGRIRGERHGDGAGNIRPRHRNPQVARRGRQIQGNVAESEPKVVELRHFEFRRTQIVREWLGVLLGGLEPQPSRQIQAPDRPADVDHLRLARARFAAPEGQRQTCETHAFGVRIEREGTVEHRP